MKYFFGLLLSLIFFTGNSQTISEWRGIGRSGVYDESGLLKKWPDSGPTKLWSVGDLGTGYSSPAMGDEYIYVTGRIRKDEFLTALTYQGTPVWQVKFGRAWKDTYPDTRTTPTIHNGKVYLISGMGEVACHDAKTGKKIWMRNAFEEFHGICNLYGISESPLIVDNKVFYSPGGSETSMIALDKNSGDLIWKTRSLGDSAAYVSPLYVKYNQQEMIINLLGNIVFGVDPADGNILWEFNYLGMETPTTNNFLKVTNCNTPIYHNGEIFVTKGYNHPAILLKLNDSGTGVTLKWTNTLLDTHFGGDVLIDGYLYGSTWINNGDGNWGCIDWETGTDQWEGRMNNKGSTIAADGMLYIYDEKRGQLALVRATPEKFDIVSSFRIDEGSGPHWSHPVIHHGVLYVRHGDRLMAFSIHQ